MITPPQNNTITTMQSGQFLQSKEWAEFQKSLNRKIFFIEKNLIIKMSLPLGLSYLYCPKGPNDANDEFINKIKKIAREERAIFLRIEPPTEPPKEFIKTKNIQPACTQILDISKPESELLSAMHEKTRYNIRLAERKGIIITNEELGITNKKFNEFYTLLEKTSARQKIKLHSKEYYKKLATFNKIFVAYHEDKPIAAAMVNFYNDTATYLHGGSDEQYKNLMAPHLLHWEIIKYAKAKGFNFYDWWGVTSDPNHDWAGISRFKKGFGGSEICAPGAYDFPIDKFWYWMYKIIRK